MLVDAIAPGWDRQLEAILTPTQVADRRAIPNGEDMTNEHIRASEDLVTAGPPFPTTPLVVIRHGIPFPGGPAERGAHNHVWRRQVCCRERGVEIVDCARCAMGGWSGIAESETSAVRGTHGGHLSETIHDLTPHVECVFQPVLEHDNRSARSSTRDLELASADVHQSVRSR